MLETFLPLLCVFGKLSKSLKMRVFPARNILKLRHSPFYDSADSGSEAVLKSASVPVGQKSLHGRRTVFTCKGLHTPLISILSKHHYFYPAQDHPVLTTVSSHQNRDEIVNLRESFEEESPYGAIQMLSLKKENKKKEELKALEWSFRSQNGAMGRRQRFKLTGKPEKPICAMESEAAGVLVASLLLFITCLPVALRQDTFHKSFLKELFLLPSPSVAQI